MIRPFDTSANGTVFGDAVGAVVLRRLDEALADGDTVYGVLKGWGVSNDGRDKAGYAAPSSLGQARAISEALIMAKVPPSSLSYVECHGEERILGCLLLIP